jgi:hypothetical protein
MVTITRLIALKQDLALYERLDHVATQTNRPSDELVDVNERLGDYKDILEDYLRIQQGSA